MPEAEKVWLQGELVDWGDAKVHVATHGLQYGSGVFDLVRVYETERGPAAFRLTDHLQRFATSAHLFGMELPFTVPELRLACWELVGANGLADGFLRSLAYYGYGEFGVSGRGNPVDVALLSWGSGSGPSEVSAGVRMTVSSWRRASPNVIPQGAKSPAVSVNSMLAVNEAHRAGYDDAIFLTDLGFVAGASSENIFVVRHGELHTPDLSTSTVLGITRDTVIEIAHALGYRIVERQVIRTDLQVADEIFVCGTAAGVTAVREVDDHVLGTAGPITTEIHATYNELVHGRLPVGGELATGLAGWPEVEPPPRVPETR